MFSYLSWSEIETDFYEYCYGWVKKNEALKMSGINTIHHHYHYRYSGRGLLVRGEFGIRLLLACP